MPRKESARPEAGAAAPTVAHETPGAIESFETEFERLTTIVDRLEAGNVPLAEMITLYEQGMQLAGGLKSVLSQAELRVEKLAALHEETPRSERELEPSSSSVTTMQDEDEDLLF